MCAGLAEVVLVGNNNAGLALDGLDEESSKVVTRRLERILKGCFIAEGDRLLGPRNSAADPG